MDLDALQTGGLPELTSIWLRENNLDENWLQQAAAKVSMRVEREPQYGYLTLEKN